MPWHRKHLLTIEELSRAEIEQLLITAGAFRRILDRKVKKVPALRGKTIVNLAVLRSDDAMKQAIDITAG